MLTKIDFFLTNDLISVHTDDSNRIEIENKSKERKKIEEKVVVMTEYSDTDC